MPKSYSRRFKRFTRFARPCREDVSMDTVRPCLPTFRDNAR
jgi:hypothetical protein